MSRKEDILDLMHAHGFAENLTSMIDAHGVLSWSAYWIRVSDQIHGPEFTGSSETQALIESAKLAIDQLLE